MTKAQVEKLRDDFNMKMMRACEANEDYEVVYEDCSNFEERHFAQVMPELLDVI